MACFELIHYNVIAVFIIHVNKAMSTSSTVSAYDLSRLHTGARVNVVLLTHLTSG